MPSLYDYLDWRGDLSLEQAAFNHVDSMILSRVSYLPLDGIVPEDFKQGISIAGAGQALGAAGDSAGYIMKADKALLPALAAAPRFSGMRLSGFVNRIDDEAEKQFCAMIIRLENGLNYLSYRGTDDTLVGWKEDFNMSFMSKVPSQLDAVAYLEEAAGSLRGDFILGGHSKGGNLAVYAASFCSRRVQKRVAAIYNFDGPGFHPEVIGHPGYLAVRGRIKSVIPQSSIVGMLLEQHDGYSIIRSSQSGFMQHDLYSWEVLRDGFIYLDDISDGSRFMDNTLRAWLAEVDAAQRSLFIDGLYSVISATQAKNFKELTGKKWYEHGMAGIKALINLDENTRMMLGKALWALVKAGKDNLHIFMPDFIKKGKDAKKMEDAGRSDDGIAGN